MTIASLCQTILDYSQLYSAVSINVSGGFIDESEQYSN